MPPAPGILPLMLVLAPVALVGCGPPMENMTRVTAGVAPLLAAGDTASTLSAVLHAGDLVHLGGGAHKPRSWQGTIDEQPASAEGEVVEARRAAEDAGGLMFRAHLGGEVPALTAAYLCRRLGAGASCARALRRIDLGDATVGYLPCPSGPCPIALVRGRRFSQFALEGLTDVRAATVGGQSVLLASAHVTHERGWSEGFVHVLRTADGLTRVHEIKTSEVDVRTPRNHVYQGTLTLEPDQIVFRGRERWTSGVHGDAVLSDVARNQSYRLAPAPR